ncbi:MAG TPA: hypothetical protein VGH77_11335 [Streptosporangiaceae bacterium]|jgi:hypothetical protein
MLTTLVTADPEPSLEELPGHPWAVRRAAGPGGRPALEIYAADTFVDVLAAERLAVIAPDRPRRVRGDLDGPALCGRLGHPPGGGTGPAGAVPPGPHPVPGLRG